MKKEKMGMMVVLIGALLLAMGCAESVPLRPTGQEIAVRFELLSSRLAEGNGFRAQLTLSNHSALPLADTGWQLYFNLHKNVVTESLPETVTATHINGDFWKMEATEELEPIAPGASFEIAFDAGGWLTKESAAPAGPYVAWKGREQGERVRDYSIEPFEKIRGLLQMRGMVPTSESRFAENGRLELLPADQIGQVVPTPVAVDAGEGFRLRGIQTQDSLIDRQTFLIAWRGEGLGQQRLYQARAGSAGLVLVQALQQLARIARLILHQQDIGQQLVGPHVIGVDGDGLAQEFRPLLQFIALI